MSHATTRSAEHLMVTKKSKKRSRTNSKDRRERLSLTAPTENVNIVDEKSEIIRSHSVGVLMTKYYILKR